MTVLGSIILFPFTLLMTVSFSLFSPLLLVLQYTYHFFGLIVRPWSLIGRLQTLYMFCGSAAVIGIIVGILLGYSNALVYDILGLRENMNEKHLRSERYKTMRPSHQRSLTPPLTTSTAATTNGSRQRRPLQPSGATGGKSIGKSVDDFHTRTSRTFPPSIPTILEEEDEDSGVGALKSHRRGGRNPSVGLLGPKRREMDSDDSSDSL